MTLSERQLEHPEAQQTSAAAGALSDLSLSNPLLGTGTPSDDIQDSRGRKSTLRSVVDGGFDTELLSPSRAARRRAPRVNLDPLSYPSAMELETERLLLREAEAADLEHIHRVFLSNPDFLELRPDIAASGGYDLASVRRYWEGAQLDPVRHVLVVVDGETGKSVGLIDFVTESLADGYPWIGLVLVHRDRQRNSIGTEAVAAVAANLREEGHPVVRMAVIEGNEVGLAFARSVGFVAVTDAPTVSPEARVVVMELDLSVPR